MVKLKIIDPVKRERYKKFQKFALEKGYNVITTEDDFLSPEELNLLRCISKNHLIEKRQNELDKCFYCTIKTKYSYLDVKNKAEENGFILEIEEKDYRGFKKGVPSKCICGKNYKFKIKPDESVTICIACSKIKYSFAEYKEKMESFGYQVLIEEKDYHGWSYPYPSICPQNHNCDSRLCNILKGYTCCKICGNEKREETCKEKYGVENPMQNKEIRNKAKETCKEKYGVENAMQNKEIRNKAKETCKERYGAENAMQNKEIRNKAIETNLKKYGVENPMQNKEIRNKAIETNIERYGAENAMQNKEIRNKAKETCKERYGFENAMQNKEIRNKAKETCKEKYGVENAMQNENIKNKVKETCKEKYGVENAVQNKEIREKVKETCKERYGGHPMQNEEVRNKSVKTCKERYGGHPMQNEEIKAKTRETNIERYGCEYSLQNEEIRNKVKETNMKRYGNNCPLQNEEIRKKAEETNLERYGYENPAKSKEIKDKTRETNLEKYGCEYTLQNEEVKEKSRETSRERYGCDHPMQNEEVKEKSRKASHSIKDYQLPSGKIVKIQGYENFCLDDLFEEGYLEEEIFTDAHKDMPKIWYNFEEKKSRYFPDIYIPKDNLIIEVKSNYTYNLSLERNAAKANACSNLGYKFQFRIYEKGGKLVEMIEI